MRDAGKKGRQGEGWRKVEGGNKVKTRREWSKHAREVGRRLGGFKGRIK